MIGGTISAASNFASRLNSLPVSQAEFSAIERAHAPGLNTGYLMKCFRRIAITALIACSSFAACKASAAEAAAKTVVLVHGDFADGSSWAKVIPLLQAKGLKVVAVQNPLSSLAADVDAARRAIEAQTGPVILVGHSYGGVVITQAGVHPKVAALVYVAAFAPPQGESVNGLGMAVRSSVAPKRSLQKSRACRQTRSSCTII
jgi:pimeloyl-ACP methyl ester carboxylesterase